MNKMDFKFTLEGISTAFIKRCLGPFWLRHRQLEKTQWWPKEQLEVLQLHLAQKMIAHAYATVPFYRRRMDALGIGPNDIRSLEDIKRFPILKKAEVRDAGNDIVSRKYPFFLLKTAYTGGSTGVPVPIRRDVWSISNENAFVQRQYDWAGVSRGDCRVYMEGRQILPPGASTGRLHAYSAISRELFLSSFHLTIDKVPEYAEIMMRYKVQVMIAYPSAAYIMAQGCQRYGINLPLKCVMTTSETNGIERRKFIAETFRCKVYDFYGSAERVCYIHMCSEGSYHLIPEYGFTELIPAESPNEGYFRIVSTGFWNRAMPLIRYQMGDLVEVSDHGCDCGRTFPTIRRILGRESQIVTTPSGRQLGSSAIEWIIECVLRGLYTFPVDAARVVHEEGDLIVLEYIPAKGMNDDYRNKIQNLIRQYVPNDFRTSIRAVDKFDKTPRGKFLSFVSNEHH